MFCSCHDIAISAAYLRLVKDESKQCMLPIFKETYIASLPSSLANVYGADTVDMFTTPQYSQPYYNIYVQVSILQTLCLQVQQACYYD